MTLRKRKAASLREALKVNLVVTRAQREFSQAALAKAAGVSRQVVSDAELEPSKKSRNPAKELRGMKTRRQKRVA